MARAQKTKRKDISVHSRAARRATEPSAQVSLSDAARENKDSRSKALEATYRNDYAGITKKTSKRMSRQQRMRKEKGMEKQEQNEDKLLKKVEESRLRAKRVKGRNMAWEDLNSTVTKAIPKAAQSSQITGDNLSEDDSEEEVDKVAASLANGTQTTTLPSAIAEEAEVDEVL